MADTEEKSPEIQDGAGSQEILNEIPEGDYAGKDANPVIEANDGQEEGVPEVNPDPVAVVEANAEEKPGVQSEVPEVTPEEQQPEGAEVNADPVVEVKAEEKLPEVQAGAQPEAKVEVQPDVVEIKPEVVEIKPVAEAKETKVEEEEDHLDILEKCLSQVELPSTLTASARAKEESSSTKAPLASSASKPQSSAVRDSAKSGSIGSNASSISNSTKNAPQKQTASNAKARTTAVETVEEGSSLGWILLAAGASLVGLGGYAFYKYRKST